MFKEDKREKEKRERFAAVYEACLQSLKIAAIRETRFSNESNWWTTRKR